MAGDPQQSQSAAEHPDLARELLDATPDPLVVVDERGVIRFANQQTAVVLGYARDELIGAPVSLLIPVGLV